MAFKQMVSIELCSGYANTLRDRLFLSYHYGRYVYIPTTKAHSFFLRTRLPPRIKLRQ